MRHSKKSIPLFSMFKGYFAILLFLFNFSLVQSNENQNIIDSLDRVYMMETDPALKVDILLQQAEIILQRDTDKAMNKANLALDLSSSAGYKKGEIRSMNILSAIWYEKTDLKLSMDYAVRAKMLARQENDQVQFGLAIYNMGKVYNDLGNYERCSELYYQCLKICEETGDRITMIKTLNSIGIVHHNQNNFDKALEYYSSALEKALEIDYTAGISKGLNNVAAIYGMQGDYAKVVSHLQDAIRLNQKNDNKDLEGTNYLNMGYYFQEIEQFDSAIYYYQKALKIYEELNHTSSLISTQIFLAGFYLRTDDLSTAKKTALRILEESRKNRLKRFEYESAVLLRKISFKLKDTISAYRFQVLELNIRDTLNIEESRNRLTILELQYAIEKEEQQKLAKQQRKDLVIIIVVLSLVFIIIVFVLFMGRMRMKAKSVLLEKEKLEMNLELRNKELTANVMSIMKKNESLSHIASRLKSIQREAVRDETKSAIRQIAAALNKAVEGEQWDEFELRFKQVHNDFYDKLIEQFPNLSPQEQRLCAFLRLNMTSKEISEITGQRVSTIEMARTRLRKKLGITNTQTNLITFLAQV